MATIHLEGMKFYAFHGHYPVEQEVGNEFIVDLKIETNDNKAEATDNLDDALNYQLLYNTVKAEMNQVSHLLEHLAARILQTLKVKFPSIRHAEVKISKINPPMGGEIQKVSVILSR
jgi:dihydroneopterin aldolase